MKFKRIVLLFALVSASWAEPFTFEVPENVTSQYREQGNSYTFRFGEDRQSVVIMFRLGRSEFLDLNSGILSKSDTYAEVLELH